MSKIHKTRPNGVTLLELIITVAIALVLLAASVLVLNPGEKLAKARDEKRLSDISLLERVVNEYKIDNGSYPDDADALRISTALPFGNTGPLQSTTSGWIKEDLSIYNTKLPTDPKNDATYFYSYQHNGHAYELNTSLLEHLTELSQNDGGNDPNVYEVGDDLTII